GDHGGAYGDVRRRAQRRRTEEQTQHCFSHAGKTRREAKFSHPRQFLTHGDTHQRFERLIERYAALLRSVVAQHCPRGVGVEVADIEQEARVRLWRALEREKDLTDPASYIYRIAVTAAIDAVRR